MANRYWVGNSGNWKGTSHWSASSGGSSGASEPTSIDDAIFDANSFSGNGYTVSIHDAGAVCNNLTFVDIDDNMNLWNEGWYINVFGNYTCSSKVSMTGLYSPAITMKSTSGGKTITTAGVAHFVITCDGVGGEWTLQDNAELEYFILTNGSFITGNNDIIINVLVSLSNSNVRALTLGTSEITCNGNWTATDSTNFTLDAGTSNIIMSSDTKTFAGGGLTYYDIIMIDSNALTIMTGDNTFNKLTIGSGNELSLTIGSTVTVGSIVSEGVGVGAFLAFVTSTAGGTNATFNKASGDPISTDYLDIKDNHTSGVDFYAGIHSNDSGNSTGWNFTAPPPGKNIYIGEAQILNVYIGETEITNQYIGDTAI